MRLVYFVLVIFFATWPWNVLLVVLGTVPAGHNRSNGRAPSQSSASSIGSRWGRRPPESWQWGFQGLETGASVLQRGVRHIPLELTEQDRNAVDKDRYAKSPAIGRVDNKPSEGF